MLILKIYRKKIIYIYLFCKIVKNIFLFLYCLLNKIYSNFKNVKICYLLFIFFSKFFDIDLDI